MAFFQVPAAGHFKLRRILSDARTALYLRPEREDQMFVGWREGNRIHDTDDLVAEDPDHYRQTSHYASMKQMHDRLAVTLPPMADGFVHRACVYDYTLDGMPILDRTESVEGLYIAVGFSGGGFSLSPWVGRSMAEFMARGTRPEQIMGFDIDRFVETRLFDWTNPPPGNCDCAVSPPTSCRSDIHCRGTEPVLGFSFTSADANNRFHGCRIRHPCDAPSQSGEYSCPISNAPS